MHQKFNLSDFMASVSFFFCLFVCFLQLSISMLSFCCGAKTIYLSKCIHEVYDRNNSQKERTAALFGWRVFNQRVKLAVFFPNRKHKTWEQRKNDGRWSNKTICQHVENINQWGAMYPPCAALPPHAALETPGEPTSSHTHPPSTQNLLSPFQ